MNNKLQQTESANTTIAAIPALSQTGDRNTQVAHADHIVINNHIYTSNQTTADTASVSGGFAVPEDGDAVNDWISIYHEKTVAEYEKMRTSLFDKTARDFYSFYVRCDIKKNAQITLDINAAKLCELSNRVIISAAGGFGKSTLMRHLLLSAIKQYAELTLFPVYIRLGDYAYSDAADMLDFILEQANCFGATVRKKQLIQLLENGNCFLLLDGLDEVSPQDIKRLDYKMRPFISTYTKNFYVVTTRPYPIHRLNSFGKFEIVDLQPLRYEQAVELVRKRERFYSDTIKGSKLSDVLTQQVFQKHEGLMRNPKLLTVMLQTYGRLNLIPDKLHILYREVVKSLTELYDTENGNTNRMLKTRLTVKAVLSRFSALCYKAYENSEYELTEQTINRYLRHIDSDIDAEDLLFDVCENLCFLETSGGKFRFFHRSMQEYFCASYLSQLSPEQWGGFRDVLRTRPQDYSESVLSFLYEMNPEMVEEHIFLPFLSELFRNSKKQTGYHNYLLSQYPIIYYDYGEPLEESDNQPLAPLLQFLVVMLDAQYEYSTNDFPFYREFAQWVTLMPLMVFPEEDEEDESVMVNVAIAFSADGENFDFTNTSPEVFPPERIRCSTYDEYDGDNISEEMGWELEFNPEEIYAAYKNDGKYEALIKFLDSDEFEFKAECYALFDYHERLRVRFTSRT